MKLCFELTMPGNNAWNGKWSGEGRLYAVIRHVSDAKKHADKYGALLQQGSFGYNFGYGWFARVSVKPIETAEARKVLKASKGFCGYEWMIDSILQHGKITVNDPI